MSDRIFTKRGKRLFVAIVILGCVIGALFAVEHLSGTHVSDHDRQLHYSELVAHQLLSQWECLPDSETEREAFILGIMQRFLPGDREQLELGKQWILDYQSKQDSGTLTVRDRTKLHDAYEQNILPWRNDISELDQRIINSGNLGEARIHLSECTILPVDSCRKEPEVGFFVEPSCIPCQQSIIRFSVNSDSREVHIFYDNGLIKWNPSNPVDLIKTEQKPNGLFSGEYHALQSSRKIDQVIADLEEQKKQDDLLLQKARDFVSTRNADSVPQEKEDIAVQREYLWLKCQKQ